MMEGQSNTGSMQQEMDRIAVKGIGANGCYEHSFGLLADRTRYYDPQQTQLNKEGKSEAFDLRPALKAKLKEGFARIHQKALGPETGGAGTAGFALVPVFVDPRIVDLSRKYTPLVEMIPRVTNLGMNADFNVITAKGAAFTAGLDAALNENDDTYDRKSFPIKFLYSVGRVLGPMQAAMPAYMVEGFQPSGAGMVSGSVFSSRGAPNAKQLEVLVKARAMKELEEELIINGSVSTDATQFDGIVIQQGTTNVTDKADTPLVYEDVDATIQKAYDAGGRPKLAVASSAVVTDLRKIMVETFRYSPSDIVTSDGLPFGVPAQLWLSTMVGPIPVIPSQFLSNTSGAKQIYFLDTDFIEMRVLQDMTFEDLAKTNDSNKFMLKIYETLILRAPEFNSFIDNIT